MGNQNLLGHEPLHNALCEQAADRAMPGRATIVRPGYIVGPLDPTDRFTHWPVRVARGGEMLAPGTPAHPIQVIDARDLTAWMLDLVEKRHFSIYNGVSAPVQFTMGGLIVTSRKVSGAKTDVTWIPADRLEQQFDGEAGFPPWAPTEGPYAGANLTKVNRALQTGVKIRPLEDTVRDTLAWHATRPADRQAKLLRARGARR